MRRHPRGPGPDVTSDAEPAVEAAVVFQPIVDLHTGETIGFEALARFHDGRGPAERLAEARAAGTLVELELRLIEQTAATSRLIPEGMLVTVNASGPTLDRLRADGPRLDERLRWGVELSEASSDEESARAREACDALGCLLLIDDAGTDCSTVERIRTLRPDMVKLDRSLVAGHPTPAALEALVAAAGEVEARLIAEGVESAAEEDLVRSLGIGLAQGFRYGRPQGR